VPGFALFGELAVEREDAVLAARGLEPVEHLRRRPRDEVPGGTWSSKRP
jgi:hypothetical protein